MSHQISRAEKPSNVITTHSLPSDNAPGVVDVAPQSIAKLEGTPTPPPTPQDPRIVELERKERLLAQDRRALAQEKAQLEASRLQAQPKPGAMTAEEWKAQFLQDPTKLGIDYQTMADKFLTQPTEQDQKFSSMEREIADLKAQNAKAQEEMGNAQKQAYDNALKQIKSDVTLLVAKNPQEYETIQAMGATQAVVDLIERTYKEEQVLMSTPEAAKAVEDYLLETALKYAGLGKVKAKIQPAESPVQGQQKTPPSQKTLSHALQGTKTLSPVERAKLAFEGKLAK